MELKSRRTFLKVGTIGIISFLIIVWNKLTLNHIELAGKKQIQVPFSQNKPVSFFDNYIVINQNHIIKVFSAHCTHLGCKINETENNRLICPCHGSEYDFSGKVVKGPAYKNLKQVPFKLASDGTQIEING